MIDQTKVTTNQNYFDFTRVVINNVCNGLAMGSPLSSSLAYLNLDHLETNHKLSGKNPFRNKKILSIC